MPSRDPIGWMWAEACQMLDQAERLQRQFFRRDFPRGAGVAWQPPVDVFEDEREFVVVVALPGVSPANAEAKIDGDTLPHPRQGAGYRCLHRSLLDRAAGYP